MTEWGDSGDRDTVRPPLQLGSTDTGRTKAVAGGMAGEEQSMSQVVPCIENGSTSAGTI